MRQCGGSTTRTRNKDRPSPHRAWAEEPKQADRRSQKKQTTHTPGDWRHKSRLERRKMRRSAIRTLPPASQLRRKKDIKLNCSERTRGREQGRERERERHTSAKLCRGATTGRAELEGEKAAAGLGNGGNEDEKSRSSRWPRKSRAGTAHSLSRPLLEVAPSQIPPSPLPAQPHRPQTCPPRFFGTAGSAGRQ